MRLLNVFLESCASGTAGRATLLPRLCLSCSWTCSQRAPRKPEVAAESLPPRSLPHISPCTSTAAVPRPPLPFVLPLQGRDLVRSARMPSTGPGLRPRSVSAHGTNHSGEGAWAPSGSQEAVTVLRAHRALRALHGWDPPSSLGTPGSLGQSGWQSPSADEAAWLSGRGGQSSAIGSGSGPAALFSVHSRPSLTQRLSWQRQPLAQNLSPSSYSCCR